MTTRWNRTAFAFAAAALLAGSAGSLGWAQDGGGAAAPAKPADAKADEDRKIADAMRAEIEALTPRRFKSPVGVKHQSNDEFKKFLVKTLDEDLPPEQSEGASAALIALGLLKDGSDLRQISIDAFSSQALAYYDPKQDTFFVVKQGLPDIIRNSTYLHELQHAMQDQVLGLDGLQAAAVKAKETDLGQAARLVFEGEAHFVELVYTVKAMQGANILQLPPATAEMIFRQGAEVTFEQRLAQMKMQAPMLGPDGPAMVAGMEKAPRFILQQMIEAYSRGAWATWRVYRKGGWEAVDNLFKNPPTSTEQMLHPDTKLLGKQREEPVAVKLPDLSSVVGAGRKSLIEDVFGEHSILILLQNQLPEVNRGRATTGAAGWGGDRLRVYGAPEGGKPLVVWSTVWDSVEDATQWAEAYRICVKSRGEREGWPPAVVEARGHAVAIIEGAPDPETGAKLAGALLDAAPPLPKKDGAGAGTDGEGGK